MNFILAWLVISLALTIGAPQEVENARGYAEGLKIQISDVKKGTPAEAMGLKIGDQVIGCVGSDPVCGRDFTEVSDVQEYIRSHKGDEITLGIKRGAELMKLSGIPRTEHPSDEGALGIGLAQTAIVSYPWYQALVEGIIVTFRMMTTIFVVFYELIRNLILGHPIGVSVSGPVGIYNFTGQVVGLGFVYILNFIALLSVNLGVINILPIPALDGGRILFILIEKFKGSPVSQKVEHSLHTAGFVILMGLMLFVTVMEVYNILFRN
jgi:regulator of sigma E protease